MGVAVVVSVAAVSGCKRGGESGKPAPSASTVPSAQPAKVSVRLERRPSVIGEKLHVIRSSSLTLGVEFWQESEKLGENDSVRKESYDRTARVEGLVGAAPAKVEVHYDHYHSQENSPGKPAVDSSLLEGKTYALDATDGKVHVTAPSGKPVTREESDELVKLHADLGKDDPLVATIGDAPLSVGEPLPMGRELLRALVTSESGELKSGRIWLEAVRPVDGRDAAIFKWTADTHSQGENGLEITWHMHGTATVRLSPAATISTVLEGSLDVGGETYQRGARVTMAGAGAIKDEMTSGVTPP